MTDLWSIAHVMDNSNWPIFNITFEKISCNGFHPNTTGIDFFAVLDDNSNKEMQNWVLNMEKIIEEAGFPIHKPRSKQTPFHSTLASVEVWYPVEQVLQEINAAIPHPMNSVPMQINWFYMDNPLYRFFHH